MKEEMFHQSPRIIGGMFGLELPSDEIVAENCKPGFLQNRHLLLGTARSAFTLLHRQLRPGVTWLPSYLCGSVLDSFKGGNVKFYGVNEELQIDDEGWIDQVHEGDMVIFIDYFGFNLWNAQGKLVREKGAHVVEDASQALLNNFFSGQADYVICSPRKFLGVPDGGILLAQGNALLPEAKYPPAPSSWWLEALKASLLRAEFDRHGGNREWFHHFQHADSTGPSEPCGISQLAELILRNHLDYKSMGERRRNNFNYLAGHLRDAALFRDLPDGTIPMGFPVRLKDRDAVQKRFFEKEIYPAIHWPIANIVPDQFTASHLLASRILTLPIDQRYGFDEMKRIVDVLEGCLA